MKNKILIVDDDEHLLNSLSAILESRNYKIQTAQDRYSALEVLQEFIPDLILLDVNMKTEQEGYEMAQDLIQDEVYNKIPVVIMTNTEIVSGNDKIINIARKFRNYPGFGQINCILTVDGENQKVLEYQSQKTGKVVNLPVREVQSKPIQMDVLLGKIKKILNN
ncbi:PleD family two-component system response regulator [Bacteroidota bacterium]